MLASGTVPDGVADEVGTRNLGPELIWSIWGTRGPEDGRRSESMGSGLQTTMTGIGKDDGEFWECSSFLFIVDASFELKEVIGTGPPEGE